MSRTRTRERRKERERQKQRQRQITIVVGVIAVVAILFFLLILATQPAEAPVSQDSLARYEGLPQSKTEEGFPLIGSPDAPVKVVEYSSFDCPHCREFHDEVIPPLMDRVRAGEISFVYVPVYGTGGIVNGLGAARAAVCAGEQDAFWTYHDALFSWQGTYVNQAFSQNRLTSGVDALSLDRAAWDTCMGSNLPDNVVSAALTAARELGEMFTGTPTILVNGSVAPLDIDSINAAIDAALAGTPEATTEATAEATAEVTEVPVEVTAEATEVPVEATAEATAEATTAP